MNEPSAAHLADGPSTSSFDTVAEHGPLLITAPQLARRLNCSTRTIYRLAASGRMPKPVRLGALVRWRRSTIDAWIDAGCPQSQCGRG